MKAAGGSVNGLPKRWKIAERKSLNSVNGIALGESWDDALPKLGVRVGEPRYSGEHVFTDTREIGSHTYEITFRRPAIADEVVGPYRVREIKRHVVMEVPW